MHSLGCSSPLKPLPTDIPSLKVLAEQGDAWAQFNLGSRYALGQEVAKDKKEAAKWLQMVAQQGDPVAQYTLGVIYENGQGVAQNERDAIEWFACFIEMILDFNPIRIVGADFMQGDDV